MARLRVRRNSIDRATGAMRDILATLEIETVTRAPVGQRPSLHGADYPSGDADVTVYVDGREMMAGPLDRLLVSLGLTLDDLE